METLPRSAAERVTQVIVGVAGPFGATTLHIVEGSIPLSADHDGDPGKVFLLDPATDSLMSYRKTYAIVVGPTLTREQIISATGSVYCEGVQVRRVTPEPENILASSHWSVKTLGTFWRRPGDVVITFEVRGLIPADQMRFGVRYQAHLLTTLPLPAQRQPMPMEPPV